MFSFMFPYSYRGLTGNGGPSITDARMAAESTVMPIEQRLQALELACAGLWSLLQTKHGYTNDELIAAIHEVDGRDGQVDGKIAHSSQMCPHCHRKLLTRNPVRCAWCGGDLGATPF